MPGRLLVIFSWLSVGIFSITAIPLALGASELETVAVVVALGLFLLSLFVWIIAFVVALQRSANGEDLAVASLFFTMGNAPRLLRHNLLAALAMSLAVVVGTAAADPFGILALMLPLGFLGLAGARYGNFPPRAEKAARPRMN